jgi:hypothetical protein
LKSQTVSENLDAEVDFNRDRKAVRGNIRISTEEYVSYYELKKCRHCFDEGFSDIIISKKTS